MPVLPYCILLRDSAELIPDTGILNSQLHRVIERDLLALYSELARDISAAKFQPAAIEFHRVVHAVFNKAAVVPFRFPTWLTLPDLSKHLERESQRYTTFLTNHANDVQMEIRLTELVHSVTHAATGTAHLRARAAESRQLRDAAENLKKLLSPNVKHWRDRDTAQGLRLYALLDRANVPAFGDRLRKHVQDITAHWSGPWPATEFLDGVDLVP
jgi:superfamily I DNA/RNA helicase